MYTFSSPFTFVFSVRSFYFLSPNLEIPFCSISLRLLTFYYRADFRIRLRGITNWDDFRSVVIIFTVVHVALKDFIVFEFILGQAVRFLAWLRGELGTYSEAGFDRDPNDG